MLDSGVALLGRKPFYVLIGKWEFELLSPKSKHTKVHTMYTKEA